MRRDWIVLNYAVQPNRFECRRCGEQIQSPTPCLLTTFAAIAKTFGREHGRCKLAPSPTQDTARGQRAEGGGE